MVAGIMKRFGILLAVFMAVVAGTAGAALRHLNQWSRTPLSSVSREEIVRIPAGMRFPQLVDKLVAAKFLEEPWRFMILARRQGADTRIKAGEYRLAAAMTPLEILDTLTRGRVVLHRLTIPEGLTLVQIAAEIEKVGFGSAEAFLELATDPEFVHSNGIDADTLEGYLFPDTYLFPENVTLKTVLDTMLKRFHQVFTAEWEARAERIGLTRHEVVTLASIIEKETGIAEERPLIASVFHNRLKKKMRLQSDPTVIYGIPEFDGNLTRKHLNTPTPYNTYQISGLPPGPIANPGRGALEAALFPPETRYLYFVAKGDRTHQFSTTLREHNRAVRQYQLGKGN